jgi:hypothetical protein
MADRIVKIEGPVTLAGANGLNVNLQPAKASAVTIASEVIYPKGLLYIGVGGDVAVIPADNPDAKNADPTSYVVFKNVPEGTFLPLYVVRVGDVGNGTTATDIVICF